MGTKDDWGAIDKSLAISGPDQDVVAAFRTVGFSEDQSRRGAELMDSGLYYGFRDVASTLAFGVGGKGYLTVVEQSRIDEMAEKMGDRLRIHELKKHARATAPVAESAPTLTTTQVEEMWAKIDGLAGFGDLQ